MKPTNLSYRSFTRHSSAIKQYICPLCIPASKIRETLVTSFCTVSQAWEHVAITVTKLIKSFTVTGYSRKGFKIRISNLRYSISMIKSSFLYYYFGRSYRIKKFSTTSCSYAAQLISTRISDIQIFGRLSANDLQGWIKTTYCERQNFFSRFNAVIKIPRRQENNFKPLIAYRIFILLRVFCTNWINETWDLLLPLMSRTLTLSLALLNAHESDFKDQNLRHIFVGGNNGPVLFQIAV